MKDVGNTSIGLSLLLIYVTNEFCSKVASSSYNHTLLLTTFNTLRLISVFSHCEKNAYQM